MSQNKLGKITKLSPSKGRYILGDKLKQHVAATRCSDKSLCVYWRIFVKIFVSATEFRRRKKSHKLSDLIFCDLLQLHNAIVETDFLQKSCSTHEAICRRNVLLQLVALPVQTE